MRHRVKKPRLNKPADHRKAMLRNLVTSLFTNGYLTTTDAKAAALVSEAEALVTKIKKDDDMNAIRSSMQVVTNKDASKNLVNFARTTAKTSGYTRSTKIKVRAGDGATMVNVALIDFEALNTQA